MSFKIEDIYKIKAKIKELQESVPEIDLSNYYTKLQTETKISEKLAELVDSVPETLNTLNELADALGNDPNFATTIATELGKKSEIGHKHQTSDIEGYKAFVWING